MKALSLLVLPLVAALALSAPLRAEEAAPEGADQDIGRGLSLLEEGAGIILRSLRDDMEPALDALGEDLDAAVRAMGPALADLLAMIGDIRNYHAPEKLPNGDIILRRRQPLPAPPEDAAPDEPGAAIDL